MSEEDQISALIAAASEGELSRIKHLVSLGVDVNGTNKDGLTPLIAAGKAQQWDAVKILTLAKADLSLRNPSDDCPVLFAAVFHDNSEIVDLLLKNGAPLDFQNSHGTTALSIAIRKNHVQIAETLIKNGADIQRKTGGLTPLDRAIRLKHIKMIDLLLRSGATINAPLPNSPIVNALQTENLDIIRMLLNHHDLQLDARDTKDNTILFYVANSQRLDILNAFLNKGPWNINHQNKQGDTVLHFAVRNQNADMVNALLAVPGINLNAKNSFNSTPLSMSAFYTNIQIVVQLLAAGADPSYFNNKPLINSGDAPFISQILLSAGADPSFLFADPDYSHFLKQSKIPFAEFATSFGKDKVADFKGSPLLERAKLYLQARLKIGLYHSDPFTQGLYEEMIFFLMNYEKNPKSFSKGLSNLTVFPKTVYYRARSALPGGQTLPFPVEFHQESESKDAELILHIKGPTNANGKTIPDPSFHGGYKNVYLSWNFEKSAPYVLLNLLKKVKDRKDEFKEEFVIHSSLKGRGITDPGHFFEYQGKKGKKFAIVQPLVGKSLVKGVNEDKKEQMVFNIFEPIFAGLNHIHEKGYVHGDIKPENILLDPSYRGYLSDFGGTVKAHEKLGPHTFQFLPPEYHEMRKTGLASAEPSFDVFALGITLFHFITDKSPLGGIPKLDLPKRLTELKEIEDLKKIGINCSPPYSHPLEDLVCKMLHPNPSERITSKQALDTFTEIKKTWENKTFKFADFQFSKLSAP